MKSVLLLTWIFICVDQYGHEVGEFTDLDTCRDFATEVNGYCVGRIEND